MTTYSSMKKTLWTGSTKIHGTYQNFGDLFIEDISDVFGTTADKAVSNYVRTLDMTKGIATAEYTSPDGAVKYRREYIASNPDGVVALRLSASQAGMISIRTRLYPGVRRGLLLVSCSDGGVYGVRRQAHAARFQGKGENRACRRHYDR